MFRSFSLSILSWPISLLLLICMGASTQAQTYDVHKRGLLIVCSSHADQTIANAAQKLRQRVSDHPLMRVLKGSVDVRVIDSEQLLKTDSKMRALNHLVILGTFDDPMVKALWQYEFKAIDGNQLYIYGFGNLQGDIGIITSDRNGFMHSPLIKTTPYETQAVILTGQTPAGVLNAVERFSRDALINAVTATASWKRTTPTLLDRDPLTGQSNPPRSIPNELAGRQRIGWSQASEEEYRGVLEDAGVQPESIWRAKYHKPGDWDGVSFEYVIGNYLNGLHRRAFGQTLWIAKFKDTTVAQSAATHMASANRMKHLDPFYQGSIQMPYKEWQTAQIKTVKLRLWQSGQYVLISSLNDVSNDQLLAIKPED